MTVGRAERRRLGENPGPASMTTPDFFRSSSCRARTSAIMELARIALEIALAGDE